MDVRLELAAIVVDALLSAAGLEGPARIRFCGMAIAALAGRQDRPAQSPKKGIGMAYRQVRDPLCASLGGDGSTLSTGASIVRSSQPEMTSLFQMLRTEIKADTGYQSVLRSHVHMALNRLFSQHHHAWEILTYGVLERYDQSRSHLRERVGR